MTPEEYAEYEDFLEEFFEGDTMITEQYRHSVPAIINNLPVLLEGPDKKYDDIFPGVSFRKTGNLLQGNYEDIFCFENNWPADTELWRGHIFDLSKQTLLARPFDKFFRFGQHVVDENLFNRLLKNSKRFIINEKMDGTLVFLWFNPYKEEWQFSTRGMIDFNPETSLQNPDMINFHQEAKILLNNTTKFYERLGHVQSPKAEGLTFIFELIHPNNRIVTKYSDKSLYLLGVRNNATGVEYTQEALDSLASVMRFNQPKQINIDAATNPLQFILNYLKIHEDEKISEGFVVKFEFGETVRRIKFITEQYDRLKWFFHRSSKKYHLELLQRSKGDPEHQEVKLMPDDLRIEYFKFVEEINSMIDTYRPFAKNNAELTDKDYAQKVFDNYSKSQSKFLFCLRRSPQQIYDTLRMEDIKHLTE